jgi:hypothetical protein
VIVNLHIDRLVLEGLPIGAHQGPLVQAAVEAELARLLADGAIGGTLPPGGATALVRTDPIRPSGAAGELGRQIGRAVFGGLGR